jgi:hypothetical protein
MVILILIAQIMVDNADSDEKKFAVENGYVSENNTLIRGWMRLDVLQSTKDYK